MIPSYPKVYNLGHAELEFLFSDPVVVQEKVDGSQFSFGKIDGEVYMRSKGQPLTPDMGGMFEAGIGFVTANADRLPNNVIYRCEFLNKPKHNTLAYDRVPTNNLVLFDVEYLDELTWKMAFQSEVEKEATNIGIDVVPYFDLPNGIKEAADVQELMDQVSFLGGSKIEGLVFKNYNRYGRDGKFLAGKYVSEKFKEVHRKDWKERNPGGVDIVTHIAAELASPARWDKAVQHLRERGELQNAPQDIGPLMKEVAQDVLEEEADAIKEALFTWAWPKIHRSVARGLPQWYKDKLLESQFENLERSPI